MKKKRILVTGGSGFIGSHVVDTIKEKNMDAVVFDRTDHEIYREDIKFILGDVKDCDSVYDAISKSDGVIHLAAVLGTQETINRPGSIVNVNMKGSINVFNACKEFGKRCVYIAVGNHWMNNPYSITKTMSERFALMFNKEFDTKIAIVRGLNAYGTRQKQWPVRKIMPNLIIPALKNEEILIYGNGEQKMDMIYVRDLADILVTSLTKEHNIYDDIIDGGMGKEPSVNYLADLVIEMTNSKSKVIHVPMRPGEIPDSSVVADTKNMEKLGFYPNMLIQIEDGIHLTIDYYKKRI